jgi:predicted methyltransferase
LPRYHGPLLTRPLADALRAARDAGDTAWTGSFDLGRSRDTATLAETHWEWRGQRYPWADTLKDRTLYWWDGDEFAPISRYAGKLIKLVPTEWGVPTFEIDGIKMLPTSKASPLDDARRKVALVQPRGQGGARHLRRPGLFRRLLPGGRRGAHPVVREERGRAVAAHAQPVVARSRMHRNTAAACN